MEAINTETYSDLKYYKEKTQQTLWQQKKFFLEVRKIDHQHINWENSVKKNRKLDS